MIGIRIVFWGGGWILYPTFNTFTLQLDCIFDKASN